MSDIVQATLARVDALLQGEPARVIGYGGAVVVYVVAKASGSIPDVPFDQAVIQAVAAVAVAASFVESIRHLVSSPATVALIRDEVEDAAVAVAPDDTSDAV